MVQSIFSITALLKETPRLQLFCAIPPSGCYCFHKKREIRSISPYLVWMWENTEQKNSEQGHFSRSALLQFLAGIVKFYKN